MIDGNKVNREELKQYLMWTLSKKDFDIYRYVLSHKNETITDPELRKIMTEYREQATTTKNHLSYLLRKMLNGIYGKKKTEDSKLSEGLDSISFSSPLPEHLLLLEAKIKASSGSKSAKGSSVKASKAKQDKENTSAPTGIHTI